MRPRHALLLIALTALPIALAVIFVGNGSLSAPSGAAPILPNGGRSATVTLKLSDASGRVPANQCGAVRHYYTYPAQGTIRFSGTVSPAGGWTVTVKLKACYAGTFESASDSQARVLPDGRFTGGFPIPIQGYYYARAEVKRAGVQVARSQKVFFKIR